MGLPNQAKEACGLCYTINREACVKDFMAAMFRVGLSKHQELNFGRITPQITISLSKITNFIGIKCKAKRAISFLDRRFALSHKVYGCVASYARRPKPVADRRQLTQTRFDHGIVDLLGQQSVNSKQAIQASR